MPILSGSVFLPRDRRCCGTSAAIACRSTGALRNLTALLMARSVPASTS